MILSLSFSVYPAAGAQTLTGFLLCMSPLIYGYNNIQVCVKFDLTGINWTQDLIESEVKSITIVTLNVELMTTDVNIKSLGTPANVELVLHSRLSSFI